jgi:hypothetical protein
MADQKTGRPTAAVYNTRTALNGSCFPPEVLLKVNYGMLYGRPETGLAPVTAQTQAADLATARYARRRSCSNCMSRLLMDLLSSQGHLDSDDVLEWCILRSSAASWDLVDLKDIEKWVMDFLSAAGRGARGFKTSATTSHGSALCFPRW